MSDAWLLTAAFITSFCGMAWLALAMKGHWQQVLGAGSHPTAVTVRVLRAAGALALTVSLLLCLAADHGSIASLVWIMALAASALVVAFALTWRPQSLRWLLPWRRSS